jgi:hypothetical protein
MKVIVPAAAKRFGVGKEMVQAALRKARLHGPRVNATADLREGCR